MRPRDLVRGDGCVASAWWITTNRGAAWAWVDPASPHHVQCEVCGPALYALPRDVVTHFAFRGDARAAVASLVEDLQRAGVVVLDVEAPLPLEGLEGAAGCVGLDVAALFWLLRVRRGLFRAGGVQ